MFQNSVSTLKIYSLRYVRSIDLYNSIDSEF